MAAIVWMCRNQLGRRNITDEQKTVLIGEAYKAQKMSVGAPEGNKNAEKQSRQNGDFVLKSEGKTKDVIAKQFGISGSTVERSERFVDGLNAAEEVSPGIKDAVLSGAVKALESVPNWTDLPGEGNREGRGSLPGLFIHLSTYHATAPGVLREYLYHSASYFRF